MRMQLRLTNAHAAVLEDHHRRIALTEVAIQLAPELHDDAYFRHTETGKCALVITMVNHYVGLADRRTKRGKIVRMKPGLGFRPNSPFEHIRTERTAVRPFSPMHPMRSIHHIVAQNRIPYQSIRIFLHIIPVFKKTSFTNSDGLSGCLAAHSAQPGLEQSGALPCRPPSLTTAPLQSQAAIHSTFASQ